MSWIYENDEHIAEELKKWDVNENDYFLVTRKMCGVRSEGCGFFSRGSVVRTESATVDSNGNVVVAVRTVEPHRREPYYDERQFSHNLVHPYKGFWAYVTLQDLHDCAYKKNEIRDKLDELTNQYFKDDMSIVNEWNHLIIHPYLFIWLCITVVAIIGSILVYTFKLPGLWMIPHLAVCMFIASLLYIHLKKRHAEFYTRRDILRDKALKKVEGILFVQFCSYHDLREVAQKLSDRANETE